MSRKKNQSHKKKPASRHRATQNRTSSKKARIPAPSAAATRGQNTPVFLLMLVIIAISVVGPTPQMNGLPSVIRLSFLLPALPLLLIYIGYKKSAIVISLQPPMLALWGLVILGVVSSFWAINTYGAITGSVKWFYVLLMSIAVYTIAGDADTRHKIMLSCALAGGYMALIGVTQYLFGHEIYVTPVGDYPWPSATSGHKNLASQLVVSTLPFALYISLTVKKPSGYWLANPLIGLMLAYLVYGRARQAFVALFVQLLIILVAVGFKRSRRLLAPRSQGKGYYLSILASLIVFVTLVFAPPFNKSFGEDKSAVSELVSRTEVFTKSEATLDVMSQGRIATWIKSANMIRDYPAGVGLNNWNAYYSKYNSEAGDYYRPQRNQVWRDAHNDYLQLLAELGLPFLLVAGLMVIGLWKSYRLIWSRGDETAQQHSLIIGMGLMGLFTVMMFSFPMTRTVLPIYLGVYLGLLAAITTVLLPSRAEIRVAYTPAVWIPILLLALAGAIAGGRSITGWHHAYFAKEIGQMVFQKSSNNRFATKRGMLLLAQQTDTAMDLEPHTKELLRDHIITYANLSWKIEDTELASEYRKKAIEVTEKYLRLAPYDPYIHRIAATMLKLPYETAMEHLGKAIALDPGNPQLYEDLKRLTLPKEDFDKALYHFEYYIPRFYNQKMNEEYARIGYQAKQQERVLNTLGSFDLSEHFRPGSDKYEAAKKNLNRILQELQDSL